MDDGALSKIFSVQTLLAIIAAINFVGWFRSYNERKRDLSSERSKEYDRLRSERDLARADSDHWHEKYIGCEAMRIETLERAVKAEATLQGYGEARQKQAIEEALKRSAKPENDA